MSETILKENQKTFKMIKKKVFGEVVVIQYLHYSILEIY